VIFIKIKEFKENSVNRFIRNPKIHSFNWIDSILEETDFFDEENQCMKEMIRHTYIISKQEELFEISFYSNTILSKDEFINNLNDAFHYDMVCEYNWEKEIYMNEGKEC